MKQRQFDETTTVSEIGLGTWQLGGDWGAVDDHTAVQIMETAVAQGVTFFDTADVYGSGLSEQRIAQFLRQSRANIFVATKLGRGGEPGWPENFTYAAMRQHTEASLRRLQVEALDLTQLHCIPTAELQRGEVFEHLRRLKQEGKIKRFGASVESMAEALICLEQDGLASLQIIFNIFRQKPIETLFAQAQAKGVAIIARLPLASGLLAGKFTPSTTFAANDHRTYNRDGGSFNVGETFAGLPFATGVELADALKPLVPTAMTMAQFAQRWILDFPAVTTIITGATRVSQVTANTAVSALPPLSPELHQQLAAFYQTKVHDHIRGPY
ncbi:MAG: aldo/keto reductase [Chloroflexi bacterium]|nr:aldo/keto reductase [Ardenticatenaceae bacterium]MBL1129898.1 aldo/keto reductase [Chloroflexota bacterium]NOG35983.1 aldo/keto reductase [Chloroflexota bacterium]GIK55434.1 MAG: oxidoreductase [Chloroflexota bacterium]